MTLRLDRLVVVVPSVAALLFALAGAGCSRQADSVPAASTPARRAEFEPFHRMALELGAAVDQGDLTAARARMGALGRAWRAAAPRLAPRLAPGTGGDWQALDLEIARATEVLEHGPPSRAAYDAAKLRLLAAFDRVQGRAPPQGAPAQ